MYIIPSCIFPSWKLYSNN